MHRLEKSFMSTLFGIHIICETTVQDGWQYRISSVYSWRIMSPWSVVRLGGTEHRDAGAPGIWDLSVNARTAHCRPHVICPALFAPHTSDYVLSLSFIMHPARCTSTHSPSLFTAPAVLISIKMHSSGFRPVISCSCYA